MGAAGANGTLRPKAGDAGSIAQPARRDGEGLSPGVRLGSCGVLGKEEFFGYFGVGVAVGAFGRMLVEMFFEGGQADGGESAGAPVGVVAEMPDAGVVAYVEDAHDGQTFEDQGVANFMSVRWDTIRTEALSGTATLDLLEQTLATLEERCQD